MTAGAGPAPPRQLTFAPARDRSPRWSPDGRRLYFVSDRGDLSQLWVLPLDGGEPRALTSLEEGAVSEPLPSPDGAQVAFLYRPKPAAERKKASEEREKTGASRPPRVIRRLGYREEGAGFLGEERRHLWRVPADGGTPVALTAGDFDVKHAAWSPDGRQIAFAANRGPDADLNGARDELLLLPLAGGPLETVPKPEGPIQALAWAPRFQRPRLRRSRPSGGRLGRHRCPPLAGAARRLARARSHSDLDRPVGLYTLSDIRAVGGVPAPVWVDGGAEVAFLFADRGATHLCSVPREGGAVRRHTSGALEVSALCSRAAGTHLVILQGDALEPGDLYLSRFPAAATAPNGAG